MLGALYLEYATADGDVIFALATMVKCRRVHTMNMVNAGRV